MARMFTGPVMHSFIPRTKGRVRRDCPNLYVIMRPRSVTMPDSAKLAVYLAEFNALRAEITNRNSIQTSLTTFTLVATGTLGSFAFSSGQSHILVLLLLVPLNAATGLLWLENAHSIFKAGNYIKINLWAEFREIDRTATSSWEGYLESRQATQPKWLERGIFLVPFFILFLGPIIGALIGTAGKVDAGYFGVFWVLDLLIALYIAASWVRSVIEFLPLSIGKRR